MQKLVSDEDFKDAIIEGLRQRDPEIDLVRAVDAGLSGFKDNQLLSWATDEGRIILSHDRKTMIPFASQRIAAGEPMAGLIVVSQHCPISRAIDDILLSLARYADEGWQDRIVTIPI